MKTTFISAMFILFIYLNLSVFAQTYYTYEWSTSTYRRELIKTSTSNPTSSGLSDISSNISVGRFVLGGVTYYARSFYQWNITNDLIPDNAIIDTVLIRYEYFMNADPNGNHPLQANFYNCINDLQSGVQTNLNTLWTNSEDPSKRIASYQTGSQGVFEKAYGPGTNMVYFVQSALSSDRFVLGIQYYYENTYDSVWYVKNSTVKLRIVYRFPDIPVTVDQLLNNTSVDSVGLWNTALNKFDKFSVPKPFNWSRNSTKVLQGAQKIISNQKYNFWKKRNEIVSDIRNHHEFLIDTSYTNAILTSQFNPIYNSITIDNKFQEVTGFNPNGDSIYFKDPWLIDYPDPLYGNTLRNRGMDAPFKQRPSPFYPDYTTSYNGDIYKGVFLNQEIAPNKPYYSVKADYVQDIQLQQTGRAHKFYFQNWSANPQGSATFQNANALETPVVFNQENATVQANLKGTQLSNNPNAYSKGSQRKFIRITNGRLFSVYESMGNIYLERSTDNGASWHIFNNTVGQRLNSYPAHSPSIDYYNVNSSDGDVVLVTFVEDIDVTTSRIMLAGLSDKLAAPLLFTQEVSLVDRSLSGYGNPVIACSGNGKFIIAFKGWDNGNYGIFYRRGIINNWQLTWVEQDPFNLPKVSNTDNNSLLPTIAEDRNTAGINYQLAWEQSGAIRYCKLVEDANGNITQTSDSVISNGSSYIFHSSPSIIAIGTGARVCWLGWNDEDPVVSAVVFRDPANSRFWSFGSNVSKPNINKSNDNTYYAFGWSQNNSTVKFADNNLSSVYEIIGITGKDVQISNGNGKTNMFANIFKAVSQPYFFTMSNNLNHYYSIQKSNGMLVSSGRTGVIRKNGGEVYFALGDITVNNQKVEFVECSPETDISNTSQLNQYLETEPFEVTDNSGFEYTVQYGIVDTSLASGMFSQGEQVRFKVELIDNNSGELVGVFDDVVYDQNNLSDFENILYQVNTQGIGQRTVKLRLRIEENINPVVSMVDRIDNEGALAKGKRKELKYEGETIPKEFALEQNYPNPFNPSTIIQYAVSSRQFVSLKVYDVLGNEVATLVNEYQEPGRYKVEFDASALASGVYIYKLTAGSFTSSKKMMVVK